MTTSIDTYQETPAKKPSNSPRLRLQRHFSQEHVHAWDTVKWSKRDAVITDATGAKVFELKDVEAPESWSSTAVNIVASKYFQKGKETSVKELIERVVKTVAAWGLDGGYFETERDAQVFEDELRMLILHQRMAFNSPVWFNVGVDARPQVSACFINSVEDSMSSILDLAKTEGMLFKHGSGAGSNLSTIRSSKEALRGGGEASGPVSFMKGLDSFAGVIKSGGKTRRAAKMVLLNADHPDVTEFINCKVAEEKKAHALIDAGYDGGFNVPGGAYASVQFQNANHSVRVTDEFMQRATGKAAASWTTRAVTTGEVVEVLDAGDVLSQMAQAAWECGDPGIQFDTTINQWHTCPNTARINGSNPCGEYMHVDDSACNLASLNLMPFRRDSGEFDVDAFQCAVALTITAQDILVDNASYPTPRIEKNSHRMRQLGLGYANLGAYLMSIGLPYDSEEGRRVAASITSLMCATAYGQSAELAKVKGPFAVYAENKAEMLGVIGMHREAATLVADTAVGRAGLLAWEAALEAGKRHGFRNAQATVLAPTGTIGFMMDCDTTGIEPELALVKYKKLVGGGHFKIVNQTVDMALQRLGYDAKQRQHIQAHIDTRGTIEGASDLSDDHLAVFDCAFAPAEGKRSIAPMGHVRMMAAVQPFLSGAISKTVNMPSDATVEDIRRVYVEGWELGLKAIAVYRDGCKRTQPLSTKLDVGEERAAEDPFIAFEALAKENGYTKRRHLPDERAAVTHKFAINEFEGYVTVGLYDDGTPGEMFIVMNKEGSVVSGLLDCFATAVSMCLQYGVPVDVLVAKFSHTRFEPSGWTKNPDIPQAKSIADYLFRWFDQRFGSVEEVEAPQTPQSKFGIAPAGSVLFEAAAIKPQSDAPPCSACGTIMFRSGSCYKCGNCGNSSGCS